MLVGAATIYKISALFSTPQIHPYIHTYIPPFTIAWDKLITWNWYTFTYERPTAHGYKALCSQSSWIACCKNGQNKHNLSCQQQQQQVVFLFDIAAGIALVVVSTAAAADDDSSVRPCCPPCFALCKPDKPIYGHVYVMYVPLSHTHTQTDRSVALRQRNACLYAWMRRAALRRRESRHFIVKIMVSPLRRRTNLIWVVVAAAAAPIFM